MYVTIKPDNTIKIETPIPPQAALKTSIKVQCEQKINKKATLLSACIDLIIFTYFPYLKIVSHTRSTSSNDMSAYIGSVNTHSETCAATGTSTLP